MGYIRWRRFGLMLALVGLAGAARAAEEPEGVYRWRLSEKDGNAWLVAAEYSATDFFGPFTFSCLPGSGWVKVQVQLQDDELADFARIMRKGVYPTINVADEQPAENGASALDTIQYADMGGWYFSFQVDAGHASFARFARTGFYQARVRDVFESHEELPVGLDSVTAFRGECRRAQP